jgi:hypothetical protein
MALELEVVRVQGLVVGRGQVVGREISNVPIEKIVSIDVMQLTRDKETFVGGFGQRKPDSNVGRMLRIYLESVRGNVNDQFG